MMTTDTIAGLYAGRLVIGLGNGFLMTFSQLYIQVTNLHTKYLNVSKKDTDPDYTGMLTSPIPSPNARRLPILDLLRLPPRNDH